MYIAPILFTPYVMLSRWANFWGGPAAERAIVPEIPAPVAEVSPAPIAELSKPRHSRVALNSARQGRVRASKKHTKSQSKKRPALARGRR